MNDLLAIWELFHTDTHVKTKGQKVICKMCGIHSIAKVDQHTSIVLMGSKAGRDMIGMRGTILQRRLA